MSDHFRLIPPWRALHAAGGSFALATVISTEGSTYRKAGACMILAEDGRCFGQLGGGNFERDLYRAAESGFRESRHRVIELDMPSRSDVDETWQRDGSARILLQYHGPRIECRALSLLARGLETPQTKVLLSVTDSSHPDLPTGESFLYDAELDRPMPAAFAEEAATSAVEALSHGEPLLVQHPSAEGDVEIFYMPFRAPLRLLLVGATPDAEPVVRISAVLGWQVTVVDPRGEYCNPARFPDAVEVCALDADEAARKLRLDEFDAAVLLTRNYKLDAAFLATLIDTRVPYLGILGSKSRCTKLVEGLGEKARLAVGRVHGPAGLELNAATPEEIALSIIAQVQATWDRRMRPEHGHAAAEDVPVHAVILAAGGSKRFGGFKQLLEFQGESLLRRSVGLASAVLPGRIIVVHGPKPLKCRRELAGLEVEQVDNPNWENGMATSLRTGIRSVPVDSSAALILLCDQPLIRPEHLRALIGAWSGNREKIAAASYAGAAGVPAIIPRKYFADILKLSGDRGAKAMLEQLAADVTLVPMPEAEVDIDTQDDYAAVLKRG